MLPNLYGEGCMAKLTVTEEPVVPTPPGEFFYECVMMCDVGYMNYCNRREFQKPGRRPPDQLYYFRFKPAAYNKPAMVMMTPKRIATHFTDKIEKHVTRKILKDGSTEERKTYTKVKFRLMAPSEVNETVRRRAIQLDLRPFDYCEDEVANG